MPDVIVSTDIDNFLKSSSAATAATAINVASLSGAAFSGQVTAPNQTASSANSMMTRELQANEQLWNMHTVRNYFPQSVGSANGGSATLATQSGATGTSLSGMGQLIFSNVLNNQPGASNAGIVASTPLTFSHIIGVNINDYRADLITVYRFVVGTTATTLPTVNPLSGNPGDVARGFGYEIYYSTSLASPAIRPFVSDTTGFTYGTSVAFNTNYQSIAHVILEKTSAGVVNIYGSVGGGSLTRSSSTPLVTLTGAPTTGNFGPHPFGVSMYMINHPLSAPVTQGGLTLIDSKVKIG